MWSLSTGSPRGKVFFYLIMQICKKLSRSARNLMYTNHLLKVKLPECLFKITRLVTVSVKGRTSSKILYRKQIWFSVFFCYLLLKFLLVGCVRWISNTLFRTLEMKMNETENTGNYIFKN
jgi:hypothetical protein